MIKKAIIPFLILGFNMMANTNINTVTNNSQVKVITIPSETTINSGNYNSNYNTNSYRQTVTTPNYNQTTGGSYNGSGRVISNSAGAMRLDSSSYYSKGQDYREKFIIVHYTAIDRDASIRALTRNDVSSHFLISDDPADPVFALVPENKRAWHAGVSEWKTRTNLNDSSIGIEIVNMGNASGSYVPYKDFQIKNLAVLLRYLIDKYEIPATNVLGHSDIAPQRKPDPGALFPWKELYTRYNIGMWYDDATKNMYQSSLASTFYTIPVSQIQQEFKKFGYGIQITGYYDEQTKKVVSAFQQRFRPYLYEGTVDVETYAILKALNDKYNK